MNLNLTHKDIPIEYGKTGCRERLLPGLPVHLRAVPHRDKDDCCRVLQRVRQGGRHHRVPHGGLGTLLGATSIGKAIIVDEIEEVF